MSDLFIYNLCHLYTTSILTVLLLSNHYAPCIVFIIIILNPTSFITVDYLTEPIENGLCDAIKKVLKQNMDIVYKIGGSRNDYKNISNHKHV